MPDFQYQPPTGPLSGSEFERQTTRFFQQVQGAADAAQSTAIVAQTTANEALERAQASNLVDGKTTTDAGGVITVKDVAIKGDLGDLASARGQVGDAALVPPHDYSTGMLSDKTGLYRSAYLGSSNAPFIGPYSEIITGVPNYRASLLLSSGRSEIVRAAISSYINETARPNLFSGYNRLITEEQIGDGIISNNGILSVPEYEGATASAAGQATYVLCGDGEWRDIATLVAAAQARLADKAAS